MVEAEGVSWAKYFAPSWDLLLLRHWPELQAVDSGVDYLDRLLRSLPRLPVK